MIHVEPRGPFNEDHTLNMPVVPMPVDWLLTYYALWAFLHPEGEHANGT